MSKILTIRNFKGLKEVHNGGRMMAIPSGDISSIYTVTQTVIRIERYCETLEPFILIFETPGDCFDAMKEITDNYSKCMDGSTDA